ncbi:YggS family pyridoxal phosphate-dependent enzyme [Pseudoclavibacter soli]|uniref:YggS family pyridoxal phosphate-dependent enzyme n=1 Tax=Pseudoclavibacter soli TaxID=452623 RepID=UPI0004887ABD|nr:YggS family pyridoxal phosphate-dependent enzyme [Pseudoclavibacter soli]
MSSVQRHPAAERLAAFESQLADELHQLGRARSEVELIVISKYHPASLAVALSEAGQHAFGENTLQGLKAKLADDRLAGEQWHFVGQLQRNKAAAVAKLVTAVHSVDRAALVERLAAVERSEPLEVFVQISLDGDPSRGGVSADGLPGLVEQILSVDRLRLRGVMGVSPVTWQPEVAFEQLARFAERVQALDPRANAISAGMSGDWRQALQHGATHLRIGTAITGKPELAR